LVRDEAPAAENNLADLAGNDKKQLLQLWGNGTYDWFKVTPDQKQVFLFGSINNAAVAGIWRNDLASDAWHRSFRFRITRQPTPRPSRCCTNP